MRKMRKFKDALIESLKDPVEAEAYLAVALEEYENDQDTEAFLLALRDVAEAQGGISKLAERTNLNRQNLYRALSKTGSPKLPTILTILHGLGFSLYPKAVRA
jgi:probable addiction module antidote protein